MSIQRAKSILACIAVTLVAGCEAAPRNWPAIGGYYDYDFASAREALREGANRRNDEQVVLDNLRLGLAALADGDTVEAESALGRTFDLLSTAGLNADRTTAAVLTHEGVRIWKGEPFEQALAYHAVAVLYAVKGDWENARAAAANALFRLTDFGADIQAENLVKCAVEDPNYLDSYNATDTDFALGFLMEAIASDLSGAAGSAEQFEAALAINPELIPLVERLRERDYDTLLIVDYGKGPTKISYGPDDALVRFEPQDLERAGLIAGVEGGESVLADAVCDVNRMAQDHRWNNLEDVRRAKSFIGEALILSGVIVSSEGGHHHDHDNRRDRELLGTGLILAGLLTKSGARADTRYLEFAPRSIYLVPLMIGRRADVRLEIEGTGAAAMVLPDLEPGTPQRPRAVYVRLHGRDSPAPEWLTAGNAVYGNDHSGVTPGDFPWILGGRDVSTPTRATLRAYQDGGRLLGYTVNDLIDLYRAEGIVLGAGMESRAGVPRDHSFRHVLEGGAGLFTPLPDSMGYKRLMFTPHPPYSPKSDLVRNAASRIGVTTDAARRAEPFRPRASNLEQHR